MRSRGLIFSADDVGDRLFCGSWCHRRLLCLLNRLPPATGRFLLRRMLLRNGMPMQRRLLHLRSGVLTVVLRVMRVRLVLTLLWAGGAMPLVQH